MTTHTIIDATGEIVALLHLAKNADVRDNTPSGMQAVTGAPPSLACYRSGAVWVDRPARPSPEHVWAPATKAWVDPLSRVERAQARLAEARAPLLLQLAELDLQAIRPLSEITAAQAAGTAPPTDAKTKLTALQARAVELRLALQALAAG